MHTFPLNVGKLKDVRFNGNETRIVKHFGSENGEKSTNFMWQTRRRRSSVQMNLWTEENGVMRNTKHSIGGYHQGIT